MDRPLDNWPERRRRTWLPGSRLLASRAVLAGAAWMAWPLFAAQTPIPWPAISVEDLAIKDNPLSAGEPALILYYDVQSDNAKSTETTYKRIKILREEGKKYANVEILYYEKLTQVEEIRARVTSPDGKSEDFSGTIYDKEIVKMKKYVVSAKTFTLPNVAVGSILEYSYCLHWRSDIPDVIRNPSRYLIVEAMAYPAAEWEIQQTLAVRHAHFVLHPIKGARKGMYTNELPKDTIRRELPDGTFEFEINNVPAFQKEEYSPPEETLKIRADVFYVLGDVRDPRSYWLSLARRESEYYEKFIGKPKSVQKEADRLLSPGDSDETKLRKIYARVQQIRALGYETEKSKKERKQESLKENKNAEDVLSHGYAFNSEIDLVFIALARAAGFQAFPVRLAARNRTFFTKERLNPYQLNSLVAEVIVGPGSKYFDPATAYCPYGFLPWEETDAGGIRVDAYQNKLVSTPMAQSTDAITRRHAELNLDAEGNLEGTLTIAYEGREALSRRLEAIDQDDAARRKDLEEAVQHSLPQGATVKLLTADGWTSSQVPLAAQLQIQVPNYAIRVGQRLVLPVGVFHASGQGVFASARRTNPVYFEYPAEVYDEVELKLSPEAQVESLPANGKIDYGVVTYESSAEKEGNSLRIKRAFKMKNYYFPAEKYLALRRFYEQVRVGDEQQAILKPIANGKPPEAFDRLLIGACPDRSFRTGDVVKPDDSETLSGPGDALLGDPSDS